MEKHTIVLSTWKHLGDYTTVTNVLYNLHRAHPEYEYVIDYNGHKNYRDLFQNNPFVSDTQHYPAWNLFTHYGGRRHEAAGTYGGYSKGFHSTTLSALKSHLGDSADYPMLKTTPDFYIDPEEYERYTIPYDNYCILNANTQTCADVKAYPYYEQVVDLCKDIQFLQIGGEARDIAAPPIKGAIDLRGKTTVRQLILLASKAKYILSGPSGIVHIGAAFPQCKKIVIIGAREPVALWDYENTVALSSGCINWGNTCGCMNMHFGPGRCAYYNTINGKLYPRCMCAISPDRVIAELCR